MTRIAAIRDAERLARETGHKMFVVEDQYGHGDWGSRYQVVARALTRPIYIAVPPWDDVTEVGPDGVR